MTLTAGARLGPYEVVATVGAGGMGEVYRARDTRLDREVALKVLPEHMATSAKALARFEREAKSLASLSHSNIVTIYDVGADQGIAFVVLELLDGETLRACLSHSPMPWRKALNIGISIADGLAAAHSKGVVHRDLKPENIFLTSTGAVKILDFGLAHLERTSSGENMADASTATELTESGMVVGTVHYMAPEQLRGRPADARSDVWGLGVVLYEMVAGERPFQGQTGFELSSAIMNKQPAPLPAKTPLGLRAVIDRCLQKEPERRYQRGGEALAALQATATGAMAPWEGVRYTFARRRLGLALFAAALLLIAAAAWLNVGGLRSRVSGSSAAPQIESLAVLPLENLSGESEQEYFADGMTEALITDLARLGGLKRVIARSSVMSYKQTRKPLAEIAKELNVDALVTGSVLRSGNRVRVTAQLINPATGEQMWAERYERDLRDVLTLQDEVTGAIAHEIKVKLTPRDQTRLAGARTVNPDAYEAYLKGRFLWNKISRQNLDTAQEYFELALQKDPNYAPAYAGIADVWISRVTMGIKAPAGAHQQAKSAVLKALELDRDLPEGHSILAGVLYYFEWDWSGAEKEYRHSIELNPNRADVRLFYSDLLLSQKRLEESMAQVQRGLQLDPLNSLLQHYFGYVFLYEHRYEEAIAQFQHAMKMEPGSVLDHWGLWAAYHEQGKTAEAMAEARKSFALGGDREVIAVIDNTYSRTGYADSMRRAAETLAARSQSSYVPSSTIAQLYAYAGRKDEAFVWLKKAYDGHESQLVYLAVDVNWDSLRDDPRFRMLLARMNLPE